MDIFMPLKKPLKFALQGLFLPAVKLPSTKESE
jgi:hypothetical protein